MKLLMNKVALKELAIALELSRQKGVGAATFRRLLDRYSLPSSAYAAWQAGEERPANVFPQSSNKSPIDDKIEKALAMAASGEVFVRYYGQPGYPKQFNDLGEPPPVVFSSSEFCEVKYAAIVGARRLSPEAVEPEIALVNQLVAEGYAIVSGGAAGADSVALQQALALGAYPTAILANGIDIVYPRANAALFAEIRRAGTLVTEMLPGARPHRSFFPARNRLIAALADVVVVVQAENKSGSMITAAWAARLGRRLLVLSPQNENAEKWAGNLRLIDAGAGVYQPGGRACSVAEPVAQFFDAGEYPTSCF